MLFQECSTGGNEGKDGPKRRGNVVASRRGRWVIKLALALFLFRKGVLSVGEMSRLHSEMWKHKALGEESLARGYVSEDADTFFAESIWKQRLGNMWLKEGFEVCARELEPYFQQAFMKLRGEQEEQEPQPQLKDDENGVIVNETDTDDTCSGAIKINFVKDVSAGDFLREVLCKKKFSRQLAKLYNCALSYVRSTRVSTEASSQAWFSVRDVLTHLQSMSFRFMDDDGGGQAHEIPEWMPTVPSHCVALLHYLDLLGRLQFSWRDAGVGHAKASTSTSSLLETEASTVRELWMRAAWAHKSRAAAMEVFDSHPALSLRHVLSHSTSLKCYDFVDDVAQLRREVRRYGGRPVAQFRPFLLIVPDVLLHQDDDSNFTAWASVLMASRVTREAAFIRISQRFMDMHMGSFVRVVDPQLGTTTGADAAKNFSAEVVWLLPSSEMHPDAIASSYGDNTYISAELLYGSDAAADIVVEALRPGPRSQLREGSDGSVVATDEQLCRLFEENLHFENWTPPPKAKEDTKDVKTAGKTQCVACDHEFFDTTAARRCLHFMAYESEVAMRELDVININVLSSRWLAIGSSLLSSDSDMTRWVSNLSSSEFADPSLILPRMRSGDKAVLHGFQVGRKELLADFKTGVFNPIQLVNRQSTVTLVVYFEKSAGDAVLATTPMLLLRPSHVVGAAGGLSERRAKNEAKSHRHRAAMVVSYTTYGADTKGCEKNYIAVEMSLEEELQYCGGMVDEHVDDGDDKEVCGGQSLQRVVVVADEWELVAQPSIENIIEYEFIQPLKRFCCPPHEECRFDSLSSETRVSLFNNLRQQLLLAVTPKLNESLEYLGDAVLDFVFSQRALDNWTEGPIVPGTTNAVLASHLPEVLRRHMEITYGIFNQKRMADVVEALFGAVMMAFWVIPRKDAVAATGLLPFTCVLHVVERFIKLMRISV